MTTSQVIEKPVEMPVLNDRDDFCHIFYRSGSLCKLGKPTGCGRGCAWQRGMTVCPCGRTICPDCIQEAP